MIDVFASEEHFADHLAPIYRRLTNPGAFIIEGAIFEREPLNPERFPVHTTDMGDPSRPVLVASHGDVKRMAKKGRTRIAFIEHGIGQSYGTKHGSYAGGEGRGAVSLFLCPNEYSAALWRNSYPDAQVEVVGCPKLDDLPRKEPGYPLTVAVSFHWDCYLLPETVSAFAQFRNVLEPLRDAYNLIGHGHPRAWAGPPSLGRRYRRFQIPPVRDFADVCRQADLYICDNSSSLYEFAATDRPVVVLNSPHYRRDVHHGLRFWEAIPGPQVDHPKDLLPTVAKALTDPPEYRSLRDNALAKVYPYRKGAADLAAGIIEEWAA